MKPVIMASQANKSRHCRSRGSGVRTVSNLADDIGKHVIRWGLSTQQISDQIRIRKCQKFAKRLLLILARLRVAVFEVVRKQQIELTHTAPALPFKLGSTHIRHDIGSEPGSDPKVASTFVRRAIS